MLLSDGLPHDLDAELLGSRNDTLSRFKVLNDAEIGIVDAMCRHGDVLCLTSKVYLH